MIQKIWRASALVQHLLLRIEKRGHKKHASVFQPQSRVLPLWRAKEVVAKIKV